MVSYYCLFLDAMQYFAKYGYSNQVKSQINAIVRYSDQHGVRFLGFGGSNKVGNLAFCQVILWT